VCRRLLAGGAEPTDEALRQAAWRNRDTECVRVLLDHGADPDSPGWGTVALHWPCMNGNAATAKLLIERGASVNAEAGGWAAGATPLHFAAAGGHDEIVLALLDAGADAERADHNGRTPLDRAVQHGHESTAQLLRRRAKTA
jgi:ankyrin repeat protein